MTEPHDPVPVVSADGAANGSMPPSGDPSLELFGQGWSPYDESAGDSDSYRGRHRAE